jgi:polysaccharide export outer membrane protein
MGWKRRGKWLAKVGALLVIWTTGAGCQLTSLPYAAHEKPSAQTAALLPQVRTGPPNLKNTQELRLVSYTAETIQPRKELSWSIESKRLPSGGSLSGTSMVGPDGMIEIGAYGRVFVGGMSPNQAQAAVGKHLSRFIGQARVIVQFRKAEPVVSGTPVARQTPHSPATTQSRETITWRPSRYAQGGQGGQVVSNGWRPTYPLNNQSGTVIAATVRAANASEQGGSEIGLLLVSRNASEVQKVAATEIQTKEPEPLFQDHGPVVSTEPILTNPAPVVSTDHAVANPGFHHGPPPKPHLDPIADPSVPREMTKQPLPPYQIEPPDILIVGSSKSLPQDQLISGQHLVRPDGTIGLGIYGYVFVAGRTLEEAQQLVYEQLKKTIPVLQLKDVYVDVLAYNSKWYYVITDGGGNGQQVVRLPITGNDTVLDAISHIYGLSPVSDQNKIWVARRAPDGHGPGQILAVHWPGITKGGETETNFQLMPGDRVFVHSEKIIRFDTRLRKFISPFERMFGITLLGSETINSIKGRTP